MDIMDYYNYLLLAVSILLPLTSGTALGVLYANSGTVSFARTQTHHRSPLECLAWCLADQGCNLATFEHSSGTCKEIDPLSMVGFAGPAGNLKVYSDNKCALGNVYSAFFLKAVFIASLKT